MLARILVHVFLFCGVVVLGASLSSNSSSVVDGGAGNSTNSTNSSSPTAKPKLLSTLLRLSTNHTAKANKTHAVENNSNKTDSLKVRQVEVVLKNLTSANETDASSNSTSNSMKIREISNDDNSTRNATDNSSANKTSSVIVERSVNLTANGTSLNDNSTKTGNDSATSGRNHTENVKKNETEKGEESESLLEKAGIRLLRRREAVSSNKTDDELDQEEDVKQADDVLEDVDSADILGDVSSLNEDE